LNGCIAGFSKQELDELDIHDINSVQAVMLFNIGDAEMTVGEIGRASCRERV